jgi:hypothetical protein
LFGSSALCSELEWQHKKPGHNSTGQVQLKDASGNIVDVNNSGYIGLNSTSSPTVLSLSVEVESGSVDVLYDVNETPTLSNYRATLSEPLVVGQSYEISGYYHRTGGSSSANRDLYQCVPVSTEPSIITYTGGGQTFKLSSSCTGKNSRFVRSDVFRVTSHTTIDGDTGGGNFNTYYGYTMTQIVQVIAL